MGARTDPVALGRQAAASGDWPRAFELLSAVDPSALAAEDLETLADAAWWVFDLHESIRVRQAAYAAFAAEGDDARAGAIAARLAIDHFSRGHVSVGSGWLAKAHRHLDDLAECPEQGMLWTIEATVLRYTGDLDGSIALAERAAALARRMHRGNLHAMSIHTVGMALIEAGEVPKGMRLLDEAMTSVLANELDAYLTGVVYCNVIGVCLEIEDLRRASEWSAAARDWCDSIAGGSPFHAFCRVNRAHVARLSGAWDEAEAEAAIAAEELQRLDGGDDASALSELGEIRRRRGDLVGSAAAYDQARAMGADPQPGYALLLFAKGREREAAAALRSARERPLTAPQRAHVLAASVDVELACDDLAGARICAAELREIATVAASPALAAMNDHAEGVLALASEDPKAALGPLRRARDAWAVIRMPYEHARSRQMLGVAMRADGDEDGGDQELRAAKTTFERLGAQLDASAVDALLGSPDRLPDGLTSREVEVLRLVASGKTNRDIAVELVLSEHTIGRHLQNIYGKIQVNTRAAATAYAFEHQLA